MLAGGYSARRFLDRLEGLVIGVNDAALRAPRGGIALSMDRLWAEHRWDELRTRSGATWLRRAAVKNIADRPSWLRVFDCDATSLALSDAEGVLNGTHSGLCAINLAYQMRPKRLVLIGFDMKKGPNGEAHWYPPYPWAPQGATSSGKFKAWAAQFDGPARQLREAGITVEVLGDTAIPAFRKSA